MKTSSRCSIRRSRSCRGSRRALQLRDPVRAAGASPTLRHCLDVYDSFLEGLGSGRVDTRVEPAIRSEARRSLALARLRATGERLRRFRRIE